MTDPAPIAVFEAYRRHGPALVRRAERILRNGADAGDVVQGLFVDLMQQHRPETALPYLYRAVTNRCLNHLRDQRNRQRLLEHQEPALRGQARARCDDAIIGADLLAKLAARLDRAHLEVLRCRYQDDLTQDEIAALLGTSRKTVGKRLRVIARHARALAVAAVLVAAALLLRPGERALPGSRAAIKGGGELVIELVRERDGGVVHDASGFTDGDRFKVVATCTAGAVLAGEVVVYQGGEASFPLAPVTLGCGNRVVVPGAFHLTAATPATVCLVVAPRLPPRTALARRAFGRADAACTVVAPE